MTNRCPAQCHAERSEGSDAPPARDADIARHLQHLAVERRLAARTLSLYGEAFDRLQRFALAAAVPLRQAEMHHIRRWAAQLHGAGLAPRSIALMLSAWRGFYRWLGGEGLVTANPVEGVRAPRAAQPLPKALSVDDAVALVAHRDEAASPVLAARDACIAELLYGCGLRVGELVGLDVAASAEAPRLDRRRRRQRPRPRQGQQAAQRAGGQARAPGARSVAGAARRARARPASRRSSSAAAARG